MSATSASTSGFYGRGYCRSESVARSLACMIIQSLSCTVRLLCSDVAAFPNLSNYFKEMMAKDTSCKPEISSYEGKTLGRSCTLSCFAWAALIKIPPSYHESAFSESEETIFLLSLILFYPIPKDTTSWALLCLQCFGSFRVILLSRRQHYTELTYVFPEPLIHSPKSIRYSLCPCKSILELHSMQIPLFFFFSPSPIILSSLS